MTDLLGLLYQFWGVRPSQLRPLRGGMNSRTWLVEHAGRTYVAKRVAARDLDGFVAGCEVAAELADRGLVTGRPVRTIDGRLTATEHALALFEHVPGRELRGDTDEEQARIAVTLAGVHAAAQVPAQSTCAFAADWLPADLAGVHAHPWLALAIEAVRAETDPLVLTWSVLHTDPSPAAFIHDHTTATTGLIDWAGARPGPVLYDVASAVMYLNGPDRAATFLTTYRDHGRLGKDEMLQLDAFRRFRWAVQGAYFARRITEGDLTGIADDDTGNEKGLDDARQALADLGMDTR